VKGTKLLRVMWLVLGQQCLVVREVQLLSACMLKLGPAQWCAWAEDGAQWSSKVAMVQMGQREEATDVRIIGWSRISSVAEGSEW